MNTLVESCYFFTIKGWTSISTTCFNVFTSLTQLVKASVHHIDSLSWLVRLVAVFPPLQLTPPSSRASQKLPGPCSPARAVKMFGQQVLVLSKYLKNMRTSTLKPLLEHGGCLLPLLSPLCSRLASERPGCDTKRRPASNQRRSMCFLPTTVC